MELWKRDAGVAMWRVVVAEAERDMNYCGSKIEEFYGPP